LEDNTKYFLKIKKVCGSSKEEYLLNYDEIKEKNIDEIIT